MLKLQNLTLIYAVTIMASAGPALAQGASDQYSAGCTGAQARQTDTTWQDVQQTPAQGNYDPGLGNTFTTGSQGVYDFNGPMIPPSATGLEAPRSGMAGPIPSGQFSYGFPNTGSDIYRGPYAGSSNNGGYLPPTSTGSVDLNIVDLQPMPMGGGFQNGPCSGMPPGWGFPGQCGGGQPPSFPGFPGSCGGGAPPFGSIPGLGPGGQPPFSGAPSLPNPGRPPGFQPPMEMPNPGSPPGFQPPMQLPNPGGAGGAPGIPFPGGG